MFSSTIYAPASMLLGTNCADAVASLQQQAELLLTGRAGRGASSTQSVCNPR